MILNKKKRIVLFVILFCIYLLFFNCYTYKVHALTNQTGYLTYDYYKNGSINNSTEISFYKSSDVQTINLFDMNFYTTSDSVTQENYFNTFANGQKNGDTIPARYFSFVFYTLETDISPEFTFFSVPGYNYKDYCNVLDTIENQSLNFYISTCSLPETVNLYNVSAKFNKSDPKLTNSNHFAFSDIYTFTEETDLIDFITQKQAEINQTIEDDKIDKVVDNIYQFISDSKIDSSGGGSTISFYKNQLPSDAPITNLLTLPITLLNAIVNGIQTTCTNFNLGNLFGYDIIFPCLNLQQYLGTSLWSTIDFLMCGFIIYNIANKLISIFLRFTSLDTSIINELYVHNATHKN